MCNIKQCQEHKNVLNVCLLLLKYLLIFPCAGRAFPTKIETCCYFSHITKKDLSRLYLPPTPSLYRKIS